MVYGHLTKRNPKGERPDPAMEGDQTHQRTDPEKKPSYLITPSQDILHQPNKIITFFKRKQNGIVLIANIELNVIIMVLKLII